jgi:hypothetical protein
MGPPQRLARGANLTAEDFEALAERLNIRPQQGFTLATPEGVEAFERAIAEFRPEVVILDSFAAFSAGIDDSNPARRAFYSRAIAPLKQRYNLALVMAAHPPLPAKDAHPDARKRPRGGGDILAAADRAFFVEQVQTETTLDGRTVTASLGELFSREGGGLEGAVTVTVEDTPGEGTRIHAATEETGTALARLGRVHSAMVEILHVLRKQPEGECYQPTLKSHLTGEGFAADSIQQALTTLAAEHRIAILSPRPPKSGKWVALAEEPE